MDEDLLEEIIAQTGAPLEEILARGPAPARNASESVSVSRSGSPRSGELLDMYLGRYQSDPPNADALIERLASGAPPPSATPPARQIDLPPMPDMPSRPETYADRSRSAPRAGRMAHAVFGGLQGLLGGGNSYGRRVAMEDADAEGDYRAALQRYGLELDRRDRGVKDQLATMPIGKALADLYGENPGTHAAVWQRTSQQSPLAQIPLGDLAQKRTLERDAIQGERQRASQTQAEAASLANSALRGSLSLKAARARSAGGGGGAVGKLSPRDIPPELMERVDKYRLGSDDADVSRLPTDLLPYFGDLMEVNRFLQLHRTDRSKEKTTLEEQERNFRGATSEVAGTLSALNSFGGFVRRVQSDEWDGPGLQDMFEKVKNNPGAPLSGAYSEFRDHLRSLVAAYISSRGGKALTNSEKDMYAGSIAALLDPSLLKEGTSSMFGNFWAAFNNGVRRQAASLSDVENFARMVESQVSAVSAAAASGVRGPKMLWDAGLKDRAKRDVGQSYIRYHPETKKFPTNYEPVGDGTVWRLSFTDGSTEDYRLR